jgi:hypothetical protein
VIKMSWKDTLGFDISKLADVPKDLLSSKVAQDINDIISKDPAIWIEGGKIEVKGARGATSTRSFEGGVSKRQMYVFTTSPPMSKEIVKELRAAGFYVANTKKPMWKKYNKTFKEYAVRPTQVWLNNNRALEAEKVADDPATPNQISFMKTLLSKLLTKAKSDTKIQDRINEFFGENTISGEGENIQHTPIPELESKIDTWSRKQASEFIPYAKNETHESKVYYGRRPPRRYRRRW